MVVLDYFGCVFSCLAQVFSCGFSLARDPIVVLGVGFHWVLVNFSLSSVSGGVLVLQERHLPEFLVTAGGFGQFADPQV